MSFKLFLGGVAPTTQKEDIESHFGQYGTVIDAVVMYKDGRHRGFGFVTFAEEEAMHAVLAEQQIIHDRTIDVKQAVPGEQAPPPRTMNGGMGGGFGGGFGGGMGAAIGAAGFRGAAPSGAPRSFGGGGKGGPKGGHEGPTDKVFLGGLAPTTTDDMLSEYFGRYGTLVDVVVMKDKLSQKSRGFGFVRYDGPDPVEQVMADYESHEIEGKWIEVKKAVPQETMGVTRGGVPVRGPPMGKGGYGGYGGGMGKGGGGYGGGKGYCSGGCGGGYGGCGGYGAMATYGAPRQGPYGGGYGGGNPYVGKGGGYGGAYPSGGAYVSGVKGGFRQRPY